MMLGLCRKMVALGGVLGGLCLPVQANTTAPEIPAPTSGAAQAPVAVPFAVDLSTTERLVRVGLVLPLQSEILRGAAESVRDGFLAAHEREKDGVTVNIIETSDVPQDTLAGYKNAAAQNDIVVGPLSRTGVTALIQDGMVDRPTIALTQPDAGTPGEATPAPVPHKLPPQLLIMGLSIEDEARQAADWAGKDKASKKAVVLFTKSAWQRRAAKAFEMQWQHLGREVELVELVANDGFLNGRALMQLQKQIQSDTPVVLFLALDARQARQVRAIVGKDAVLYGTSQLNPVALSDWQDADRTGDMDGTRLLDIPWQLQADHPAVMAYPRPVAEADQKRSADMERLYALGIDAYRVARELALGRTGFELDGVTGKLTVRFDQKQTHFERTVQQAIYRDGSVVPVGEAR
ncbi:MAG TPA: penicillin-binding protein activator [Noviherbaspirillum sp.]|nr:penicillin-binding protein activator [Noviherbaspirillum sp.]